VDDNFHPTWLLSVVDKQAVWWTSDNGNFRGFTNAGRKQSQLNNQPGDACLSERSKDEHHYHSKVDYHWREGDLNANDHHLHLSECVNCQTQDHNDDEQRQASYRETEASKATSQKAQAQETHYQEKASSQAQEAEASHQEASQENNGDVFAQWF
jgi:hypothetical protein